MVKVCCDEAEIFIALGGRVGPLWKLKENLSRCLALRDCHTHLLISAGIGWAGTLSGRLSKFAGTRKSPYEGQPTLKGFCSATGSL